jgi:hypothetical protein
MSFLPQIKTSVVKLATLPIDHHVTAKDLSNYFDDLLEKQIFTVKIHDRFSINKQLGVGESCTQQFKCLCSIYSVPKYTNAL